MPRRFAAWAISTLLLALLLGGSATEVAAAREQRVRVEVEREGGMFYVLARAEIAAEPRIAWETITDYEALPRFIPGLQRTRVLRTGPQDLTVEYAGEMRFWLLREPIYMRLAVRHEPYAKVVARSAAGADAGTQSVRRFLGRYDLTVLGRAGGAQGAGVRLTYGAEFETARNLPPLIGTWAVRQFMREQFEAMVLEIERRQALRPGGIERSMPAPAR